MAGTAVSLEVVSLEKPEDVNVIVGQAHFIKTVEDLHAQRLGRVRGWTRTLVHLSREGLARANPGLDHRELDLLWVEHQYGPDVAVRLRKYLEKGAPCKSTTS